MRARSEAAMVGNSSTDSSAAPTSAEAMCGLMLCVRTPMSLITTTSDNEATDEYSAKGSRSCGARCVP